jgi:hypothetical protein
MLEVVRQRLDLRQLLRLMYTDTGGGSTHDSGGSGSAGSGYADGIKTSFEAGSSVGDGSSSSSTSSRGSDASGDSVDSSAAAAWRAAASGSTPQQEQTREAVTAAVVSLAEVIISLFASHCSYTSVVCTARFDEGVPSMHCHRRADMDKPA